jgi:glycosyltransferase involved in cell wall biosynthesis
MDAPSQTPAAVGMVTQSAGPPRISVVVPAYNEDEFLASCLGSLLQQSDCNLEIIVVDDGSSDRTPAVAATCAERDGRIRIMRNDENCGLPRSLNRGFQQARGEMLTWISGDNWAGPTFVAALSAALDADPDVDVVYGDTVIADEAGQLIKTLPREGIERLAQRNVVRSCFMFRRQALERAGPYKPRWAMIEDYEFWLRCRRAGLRFHFVAGPVIYHRLHPHSLTAKFRGHVARLGVEARAWHLRRCAPQNPQDIIRLVKDVMRHLPLRRALRHAVHWSARASLRQRPRLWVQIGLELAARCLRRDGNLP